jgi:ADP-ribose pyrophosphatase
MDRDLRERLIASQPQFRGRLFSVFVDEVELADGTRTTREIVRHPGAVAIVPILPDGRVAMIRQYRRAAGEVLWELPAGVLRPDETPAECARRELGEEIGREPTELTHLLSTYLSPGYSSEVIHIFLAGGLRPTSAHEDADERIDVVPLPLSEAVAMVLRGEVRNAAAICGLLAAARRRCAGRQDEAAGG